MSYMSKKQAFLSNFMEKIDLNGLSKTKLLNDNDCFGLLYGATICKRCNHPVIIKKKKVPLNKICKSITHIIVASENNAKAISLNKVYERLRGILKAEKIVEEKAKRKQKKIDTTLTESKKIQLIIKALSKFAKRKRSELDWISVIYEIADSFDLDASEVVLQYKEIISKSCNASVLYDYVRLSG